MGDVNERVLPQFREIVRDRIAGVDGLDETSKKKLFAVIESLPDGDRLCHGDLHPENVMVDEEGELMVIDWLTAGKGCLEADLARTW